MHIHILGICGTFMGGLAVLAKEAGHKVTGCDANVYPPMSTQLEAQGIELIQGFDPEQTKLNPDLYVIGNVVSRAIRWSRKSSTAACPMFPARNGWGNIYYATNGCWPWLARMARPPPRPCWRGYWKTPAMHRAS